MPHRLLVARELSDLFGLLGNHNRIRIIEELRDGEHNVNALQAALGISHAGVSQHLILLRAHHLVSDRRQGRQVFYQLRQPELATWLTHAMTFLEAGTLDAERLRRAIRKTRTAWATHRAPPARH